jgi:NAD(P)-dependent dehydrogenase (short-subunit alcohol dehydrogenase family)
MRMQIRGSTLYQVIIFFWKGENDRMIKWTTEDIPSQAGRCAVVTGANSGLGYSTARALAMKGARVIMACRNLEKGEVARQQIMESNPDLEPELCFLDLSRLSSVHSFAEKYLSLYSGPDLLINNAGVMAIPYMKTSDGFEMQFGVNHLGHFALTALLWPGIQSVQGARIINVGSASHHFGKIRFGDIHWEKKYRKWGAYGMSKLANLLFTMEMARRLRESESDVTVAAAHPGYADTSLHEKGMLMGGSKWKAGFFNLANRFVAQPAEKGALPTLFAAVAPEVGQGAYFGPGGLMRLRGWPAPDKPNHGRVSDSAARELWRLSETLTGLEFQIP